MENNFTDSLKFSINGQIDRSFQRILDFHILHNNEEIKLSKLKKDIREEILSLFICRFTNTIHIPVPQNLKKYKSFPVMCRKISKPELKKEFEDYIDWYVEEIYRNYLALIK